MKSSDTLRDGKLTLISVLTMFINRSYLFLNTWNMPCFVLCFVYGISFSAQINLQVFLTHEKTETQRSELTKVKQHLGFVFNQSKKLKNNIQAKQSTHLCGLVQPPHSQFETSALLYATTKCTSFKSFFLIPQLKVKRSRALSSSTQNTSFILFFT